MKDDPTKGLLAELREDYNPPPETPREEMWSSIQARLRSKEEEVISLEEAREAKRGRSIKRLLIRQPLGWAMGAAAVLLLGLGIGRMTAPGMNSVPGAEGRFGPDPDILRVAAMNHLSRTESLLTLIRADGRSGRMGADVGVWARNLLTQTRLLMDSQGEDDPIMDELLKDLELVLIQLVGAANGGDPARVRSELELALEGLEESEVLPRIRAVVPPSRPFAGT